MAYKILIVDDEKMLTELLSSHLQDCGYEAHENEPFLVGTHPF